ncbi:hypothetical protein M0R45_006803 [Rubus argutus]|uniref:Uncharacterized protein n=1 Tax=Rubus argutus TaxID=59490 RepID=A0AAW1YS73_RUBAR
MKSGSSRVRRRELGAVEMRGAAEQGAGRRKNAASADVAAERRHRTEAAAMRLRRCLVHGGELGFGGGEDGWV